jgi:hypothetical protein
LCSHQYEPIRLKRIPNTQGDQIVVAVLAVGSGFSAFERQPFSLDSGKILAWTTLIDGTIQLIDVSTDKQQRLIKQHPAPVHRFGWSLTHTLYENFNLALFQDILNFLEIENLYGYRIWVAAGRMIFR